MDLDDLDPENLSELEILMYSQVFHSKLDDAEQSTPQKHCPDDATKSMNFTVDLEVPSNKNRTSVSFNQDIPIDVMDTLSRGIHNNITINHYVYNLQKDTDKGSPSLNGTPLSRKKKRQLFRKQQKQIKGNTNYQYKTNSKCSSTIVKDLLPKNNVIYISDESDDDLEIIDIDAQKVQEPDEVIFVSPEPVETIAVESDEERSTMDTSFDHNPENDFLETVSESRDSFDFRQHGSDIGSALGQHNEVPKHSYNDTETETTSSTTEKCSRDHTSNIFDKNECPKADLFAESGLEAFERYITPERGVRCTDFLQHNSEDTTSSEDSFISEIGNERDREKSSYMKSNNSIADGKAKSKSDDTEDKQTVSSNDIKRTSNIHNEEPVVSKLSEIPSETTNLEGTNESSVDEKVADLPSKANPKKSIKDDSQGAEITDTQSSDAAKTSEMSLSESEVANDDSCINSSTEISDSDSLVSEAEALEMYEENERRQLRSGTVLSAIDGSYKWPAEKMREIRRLKWALNNYKYEKEDYEKFLMEFSTNPSDSMKGTSPEKRKPVATSGSFFIDCEGNKRKNKEDDEAGGKKQRTDADVDDVVLIETTSDGVVVLGEESDKDTDIQSTNGADIAKELGLGSNDSYVEKMNELSSLNAVDRMKLRLDYSNYDMDKIYENMTDDPSKWQILHEDRPTYLMLNQRPKKGPRCNRCRHFGHPGYRCPEKPEPPKCFLCGEGNHQEPRCPYKLCLNCGNRGNYTTNYCYRCFKFRHVVCRICDQPGHIKERCPDLWRRYYLTTAPGPIKVPQNTEPVTRANQWCSGCASQGHLEHECSYYNREYSPTVPFILQYNDIVYPNGDVQNSSTSTHDKSDVPVTDSVSSVHVEQVSNGNPLAGNISAITEGVTCNPVQQSERKKLNTDRVHQRHVFFDCDGLLIKEFIKLEMQHMYAAQRQTSVVQLKKRLKLLLKLKPKGGTFEKRKQENEMKRWFRTANMFIYGIHKMLSGGKHLHMLKMFSKRQPEDMVKLTYGFRNRIYQSYLYIFDTQLKSNVDHLALLNKIAGR